MQIIPSAMALMALVASTTAQRLSTQCFADICYQLNIPETTARSGSGNIYFQIFGPSSYSWIALGQGTQMAGANIFVIYADGQGNVTLSPRHGTGHVEPEHDTTANATLLAGSGVANGRMVANIRCANCESWGTGTTDFSSSSGDWIHAALSGSPINSADVDAQIGFHSAYGPFTWGYTNAQGGSSTVNPFVSEQGSSSGGNGVSSAPTSNPNNDGDGSSAPSYPSATMFVAHGTLAALAFVALFPIGALLLRIPGLGLWIHAGFQILAYCVFITAAGLGIYLATSVKVLNTHHPIIGMVLLGVLFFQPFFGLLHHHFFKKSGGRTGVSHMHVWIGRLAVLLGMINAGLGIQASGRVPSRYIIVYGVFAGIMGVLFVANAVYGEIENAKRSTAGNEVKGKSERVGSQEP